MNASAAQQMVPAHPVWRMPIHPERYDRCHLSESERMALAVLVDGDARLNSPARRKPEAALVRLTRPLHDVYALRRTDASVRPKATRVMFSQMHRRGKAFWQWSAEEWCDVVGVTAESFEAANGLPRRREGLRPHLLDVAYLLCGFERFGPIWMATAFYPMARVVFGAEVLDSQIARVDAVLANNGYSSGHESIRHRHQAIAFVLLLNRSPWLDDLSWSALEHAASMASVHAESVILHRIAKALVLLRIITPGADDATPDPFPLGPSDGVPEEWYAWYRAWRATGSRGLAPRIARHYGGYILYAGRWLARRHPGVVSPEQWTEELALAMRTAVLEETNDVFVSASGKKTLQQRNMLGRRLGHAAISQFLASLRRFFRDLQTKAHVVGDAPARRILRRFDPREALATPEHVEKALVGSEPRDIALAVWQRLAVQAARLTPEDLGPLPYWPFSAVQALAFLWVSTARRPNELLRLRVDCVRTQWEPDMSDEAGDRLPPGTEVVGEERGAKVSYLHIPSSKYGGPGWIWIPKYTADAIVRWQAERGGARLALFDQKDREFAQLLFTHRGKGMCITFLNRRLIPLLCRKAGVDPRDAEGAYTAHRGRSARISMLHACGLELEDLAAYAIHKNTQTIKKYARRNPIHLHRRVAQADTLSTVIEGLYDPAAAAAGAPSVRWFLGYDAEGAPQFCGLPAHHTCPHRMDCSRCGLFIGGERARLVHDDPTLLKVTADIPMTEVQRLLNEGQREAASRALAAAKEVAAPVPPSVAFLTNPSGLSDTQLTELAELATDDARAQLKLVADDLITTLAEQRSKDGRNVAVTALRRRLAFVQGLIRLCAVQPDPPAAITPGSRSGTHPI
jgi:integrase